MSGLGVNQDLTTLGRSSKIGVRIGDNVKRKRVLEISDR
jgi:hypothetical protein